MEQQIINYNITDAAIVELANKYSTLPDIKTKDGYALIRTGIADIRDRRIQIEKKRKELKTDAIKWGRTVDGEAKRITTALLGIEDPMKEVKNKHDEQIKAEKEAKKKAEEERRNAILKKIQNIQAVLLDCTGKSSTEIKKTISIIQAINISESFAEFRPLAEDTKQTTLTKLNDLYERVSSSEKEDCRRKEEAERLAKERAEFEKQKAEAEERRKAEELKLNAEREAIKKREAELESREKEEQEEVIPEEKPPTAVDTSEQEGMGIYRVEIEWSGYSRGTSVYEIKAESEEQAKESYYEGKKVEHDVVRDDTEDNIISAFKIIEKNVTS